MAAPARKRRKTSKTTRKRKKAGVSAATRAHRSRRRKRQTKKRGDSLFLQHLADAGVVCLTAFVVIAALFALIARDLPDTNMLWRTTGGPKLTMLAADGAPIPVRGSSAGAPIRLADLPAHVPHAVLAVEDRNFYHHFGVNPVSIVRAAVVNARRGGVVQGGSTISQQLAKNIFLQPDRTLKRKVQELILAIWLEQRFSKDEILTLYLNRVYFGGGAYGVDAASHRYFGKAARYLTVGEAAVLAGLLKAPSRLAPTSNPTDSGRRGRHVIELMVTAGFISRAEGDRAIASPIRLAGAQFQAAPYFVDYIASEVRSLIGAVDEDLIVRTTFDPYAQRAAELGMAAGLAREGDKLDAAQAALVLVEPDGALRAMIGGRDYAVSQFNRASQAQRQPGSAFKPIVYLAAMQVGARPNSRVLDAPVRIGRWSPDNYKSKYRGDVSLSEAFALSLNGAAVRVQETAGRSNVRATARAAGWGGGLTQGPALALGVDEISPLALAGVYASFANGGYRVRPYAVESIATSDGDVLYRRNIYVEGEVASRAAIDAVNAMMRGVVVWGTGKAADVPGYEAVGKTGTTQNSRDAWFAGHAGGLVGVVWVGHDDNTPMPGVTGGGAPAIIWGETMARVLPPRYVAPLQAAAAVDETG